MGKGFFCVELLLRIDGDGIGVKKLFQESPAFYVIFDLLATVKEKQLAERPLSERRPALEAFAKANLKGSLFRLSPAATSYTTAKTWLAQSGGGSDGVIAKRIDLPYQAGTRDGMQKIKKFRSAD